MKTLSSAEKVVGVDVDGSLIYEKTYMANGVNISASTIIDSSINLSNARIVSINGSYRANNTWYTPVNYTPDQATYYSLYTIVNNQGVRLTVATYTLTAYHVTIRYVKL